MKSGSTQNLVSHSWFFYTFERLLSLVQVIPTLGYTYQYLLTFNFYVDYISLLDGAQLLGQVKKMDLFILCRTYTKIKPRVARCAGVGMLPSDSMTPWTPDWASFPLDSSYCSYQVPRLVLVHIDIITVTCISLPIVHLTQEPQIC